MFIGLLLVNEEDDILADTLAVNAPLVDCFYVLDGTVDNTHSRRVCRSFPNCAGYSRDRDVPKPPYPPRATDGYRQFMYEQAVRDHGFDHWFLLLHADETWMFHPSEPVDANADASGFIFRLPLFFPHIDDGWDDSRPPLDQLRRHLAPGWPEFRMFRGNPEVAFDPGQHFNVVPYGLAGRIASGVWRINHYPFRSPRSQEIRAKAGFDPDNYALVDRWALWTDETVAHYQQNDCYRELRDA